MWFSKGYSCIGKLAAVVDNTLACMQICIKRARKEKSLHIPLSAKAGHNLKRVNDAAWTHALIL